MAEKTISLITLAALLGLPETTDEAGLTDAIKKRLVTSSPTTLSAADVTNAVTAGLKPLADRLMTFETRLADGEKATTDAKRAELVTLFATKGKVPLKADGKAYTADEMKTLPLDTLQLLLVNTAVTVPLSARNAAHSAETKKGYRVKVGEKEVVDLGAIFDDEAKSRGLTANPTN